MEAGARRFSRRMGTGKAARVDSPDRESLFDRRRASHRAHARAGAPGRISAALGQRDPQRQGVFVRWRFGGGKDNDLAFGAVRMSTLLTDEISYVRKQDSGYIAFGTPFTGELAKLGENVSAPVAALYLLAKGGENRIDPIAPGEAARSLLANLLFFAEDEELVQATFHSAFEFVSRVPVSRLTFVPDARVWELIG